MCIEGFTSFICFAAGHEIIRQRRRDLTLIRMTPDLIYDQMVAAGVAQQADLQLPGQPGRRPAVLPAPRGRAGHPAPLELEEYSHYGMVGRYLAGASRLPFFPLRSYLGSDLPSVNERIKLVEEPLRRWADRGGAADQPRCGDHPCPARRPPGNTQLWGLLGVQKEAAFAAKAVIVVVEEIVDEAVIRADPNRTLIPGLIVDAVVHEPYAAHPSYAQGYYDRDNEAYLLGTSSRKTATR